MTEERKEKLFNTEGAALAVCVGSWKAYTECNNHALGSCYKGRFYINFDILEDADELRDLLASLGWSDLEMEETFIQDYESALFSFKNCDYISCFQLIEDYAAARDDLLNDEELTRAISEYLGSDDFAEIVEELDRVSFYPNMTGAEVMEELTEETTEIPDNLKYYIDYEAMARDEILSGYMVEVSNGVLLI